MRYTFALMLAVLCTVSVVAAQTPASPPAGQEKPSTSTPPASSSASANKVTYTGCLKPGTAADSWTLENAEVAAAAGAKPSATATSGASKNTLALTVKPGENLKPHANHKIEVTGTMSPSASGAASGGAGAASSSTAARQNFTVESFKMVSATCP